VNSHLMASSARMHEEIDRRMQPVYHDEGRERERGQADGQGGSCRRRRRYSRKNNWDLNGHLNGQREREECMSESTI
jgi:hypothetical protein